MSNASERWSTIRIAMRKVGTEPDAMARASERLEGLAALLADNDDVGGVETRDPSLITEGPDFVAVEQPELIAYSTPTGRARVEALAQQLAAGLALEVEVSGEDHEGDDWRDAWKRYYRSLYFRAGSHALMIRPSWIPRRDDDPKLELILDPGRAFGTGLHESTRLCLQSLVELDAAGVHPSSVLDLGCGSGILGVAAAGGRFEPAGPAFALPGGEPGAPPSVNAELNALHTRAGVHFTVLDLLSEQVEVPAAAELVFANIRPRVLIPAAQHIAAALAPGGHLLLSGILDEEDEGVLAASADTLSLHARHSDTGWTVLVMRRSA